MIINRNIVPSLFLLAAFLSALACSSRMDFNFPILVLCFFIYTSTKVGATSSTTLD